ncbi:hypothetical protein H312_00110 [Anncaliia algerae PRA339]|uniref:DUF5097 domain-containing protein n=1 Tax=Anncaliia algerae PRA339 TaxID=1288291 RepID=A0A059F5R2_9MICR|nr:hypothetical protein H312_00110 [Anncaliia algerae PRA339]
MVDSYALKKYIIRYYLDHSISPIEETANKLSVILQKCFVPHELVIIKATKQVGKVVTASKENYMVEVDGSIEKKSADEIMRKEGVGAELIRKFLEANTKISPFGRVLRKNVLQQISQSQKDDSIVFNGENKNDKLKKEEYTEKRKPRERIYSEQINYNTRNFTANEFLRNQNEKSFFSKQEIINDDTSKDSMFISGCILKDKERLEGRTMAFSREPNFTTRKIPIDVIKTRAPNKPTNESELLTLKIKEILKKAEFKNSKGEFDLNFKKKISYLLDSKAIKNHPNEINIKRKLIDLLTNPNTSEEILKGKVNEMLIKPERKKIKVEEKVNFLEILNEEEYEEIAIKEIKNTELLMEVFLFFFYFRNHFNFEFTFERFVNLIKGEEIKEIEVSNEKQIKLENKKNEENKENLNLKMNSEMIYILFKCLIQMIQEDFKSVSKSQFKSIIENSLIITVKETKEEGISSYKKYDWFNSEITLENWKNILKNFYSYIFNILELEKIASLNDLNTVDDKLLNLKFLIHCCYSTNKFRSIINASVEENRMIERNKTELIIKLKNLHQNSDNLENVKEEIKKIEEEIVSSTINLLTTGYKADLFTIDNCLFIFLNGVCFWLNSKLYRMKDEQVYRFMERLKNDPKVYGCFFSALNWWLNKSFKEVNV